ncbi:hypothetical protein KUCAC02_029366 [Chaenocephalus aceratus]|uniref:Uncharacterized protein n=1 Tax=Chaenocephalus aceratus TaxID=36190 RepID=A0ACB9X674_CHAAC|nr:hypothetical protein KUCAC02_029366 [Chaenocephalus aceratus]
MKSDTAVPSWESASRCPEEARRKPGGSPKHEDPEIQMPIQTRHSQRLAAPSRSSEKPEPSAETHMLICTAERSAPAVARAGLKLGLGQILLLSKNSTVHGCVSALVAPLS